MPAPPNRPPGWRPPGLRPPGLTPGELERIADFVHELVFIGPPLPPDWVKPDFVGPPAPPRKPIFGPGHPGQDIGVATLDPIW